MEKIKSKIYIIAILMFFIIIGSMIFNHAIAEKIRCSNFRTRPEAQKAYNSDSVTYAKLDGRDKDGKVCESLPIKIKHHWYSVLQYIY